MAKKSNEGSQMPESVTLAAPYAFYEEDGTFRSWQEGHVVTDPEHVALLIERKAPVVAKEDQNG